MSDVHHKLSPSAAHRWLECPGSLTVPCEGEPSVYATEGTAAHELAAACWLVGIDAQDFADATGKDIPAEMIDAVSLYLNEIDEAAAGAVSVNIERHIVDREIPDLGGTLDCLIVHRDRLTIIDFKYGAGVVVEVEDNPQLVCYARLARSEYGELPVTVKIVQPRAYHPDGPVRAWNVPERAFAELADRIEQANANPDLFRAGDHCRWCPARTDCPELYQLALETARAEFNPHCMTADRAADVLGKANAIGVYLDAVKDWASAALKRGDRIPGYKLVKSLGHRRWAVDAETVIKRCRSRGLGKKQVTETTLLSPAKLEKLTDRDFVDSLSTRPVSGLSVVPETDRRPAYDPVTEAQEEFAACQPEC